MNHPGGGSDADADTPAGQARARARQAGNLLHRGRLAEALAEYDWLWRHLHHEAPSMSGVRLSFTASEIGHLCRQFEPAQLHFEAIRDATLARLNAAGAADAADAAASWDDRLDWMVLNEIVGQAERTLEWFDRISALPGGLPADFRERCIPRLVPLLRRRGRWAEIGRLFVEPLARLRADHATMLEANARTASQRGFRGMNPQDLMKDLFREQAHILVRGLHAAGRGDEAVAVEREAQLLDDSTEMREALAAASPG